eukprot:gene14329-biopygen6605
MRLGWPRGRPRGRPRAARRRRGARGFHGAVHGAAHGPRRHAVHRAIHGRVQPRDGAGLITGPSPSQITVPFMESNTARGCSRGHSLRSIMGFHRAVGGLLRNQQSWKERREGLSMVGA